MGASLAVTALCALALGTRVPESGRPCEPGRLGCELSGGWRPPELKVDARKVPAGSEEIRERALRYLGRPYDSGGVGSPGFDCSGFTCRVFAEGGYALPRVSRDQAQAGRKVPIDQLRPGDLLFFADRPGKTRINHVGIYLGDGELAHASTGEGEVVVASLRTSWFRDHLVFARRVIGEPSPDFTRNGVVAGGGRSGAPTAPTGPFAPALAPTVELVEHTGEDTLSPLLRRPARVPRVPFGPELPGMARTAVAVRGAAITEAGRWGVTLAPELSLYLRSIALEVALALPIRFDFDQPPTLGEFSEARDFGRLVRTIGLGLRGADVELRVSQFGDLGLLSGLLVDDLAPGSRATGVPGFSLGRAPLGFTGRVRTGLGSIEGLVDDVFEPGLVGIGLSAPIGEWFRASAGYATDQRAAFAGGRRAVNALEAELALTALETPSWSLEASLAGAGLQSLGELGGLARLRAFAEHRFTGATSAHFAARVGWVGRHALDALFSATYPGREAVQLSALGEAGDRAIAGAELSVHVGRFLLGAAFEDALGREHLALDRRLEVLTELKGLSLSGTRLLDLRVAYAVRGLGRRGSSRVAEVEGGPRSDRALHVLHGALALRLSSALRLEVYVEHGAKPRAAGADSIACATDVAECAETRTEAGAGVALAFEP